MPNGATKRLNGAATAAMLSRPIAQAIFADLVATLFDVPIMGNRCRADYVERLVTIGLSRGFTLKSADWVGWDIEHETGFRIEVKQSAARQPWTDRLTRAERTAPGSFDIAPRRGYWTEGGATWVPAPGRHADIHILAWHPVTDPAVADHRDAAQWRFFVVPTLDLPPDQKTIARTAVEKRWPATRFDDLRGATLTAASQVGWL